MEYGSLKRSKSINYDIYKHNSVQFNILSLMLEDEPFKLYSDNSQVIICQPNPNAPVWIWTDYNITQENTKMLHECIYNEFEFNTTSTFVVKPVMSDIIKQVIKEKTGKDSFLVIDMMTYQCIDPIEPESVEGYMQKADLGDIDIITEYRANDLVEMDNINTSKVEQWNHSKSLIESDNLYIWKNIDGNTTSMAFVAHRSQKYARINRVYSEPKYRNKGYAGMLMYELSKLLLKEGRVPVVYTDNANPASNKAYKKVGYKECGNLYKMGIKG